MKCAVTHYVWLSKPLDLRKQTLQYLYSHLLASGKRIDRDKDKDADIVRMHYHLHIYTQWPHLRCVKRAKGKISSTFSLHLTIYVISLFCIFFTLHYNTEQILSNSPTHQGCLNQVCSTKLNKTLQLCTLNVNERYALLFFKLIFPLTLN